MREAAKLTKMTPSAAAAAENAARPKVMRRPASFSTSSATLQTTSTAMILAAPIPTDQPPVISNRSWQDDGRFAITLLAMVVVVNLAIMAWLTYLHPTINKTIHVTQSANATEKAPEATTGDITLFSPAESSKEDRDIAPPPVNILDSHSTRVIGE